MKLNITVLLLVFSLTFGFAQQYPPVSDGSPSVEKTASDIANAYDKELSMTAKQKALFKLKVEDYLIRKRKIEAQYEGREELAALTEMQAQETLDMNDILTRIQMQVYKKVKPRIQPLKMVNQ